MPPDDEPTTMSMNMLYMIITITQLYLATLIKSRIRHKTCELCKTDRTIDRIVFNEVVKVDLDFVIANLSTLHIFGTCETSNH